MMRKIAAVARRQVRGALFVCSMFSFWAGSGACGDRQSGALARAEQVAAIRA